MKLGWGLGSYLALGAAFSLAGCAQMGNVPAGTLPRDVHAPPSAEEVAANPCGHGDVARCIAKCQAHDPQACNAAGILFEFDGGESSEPAIASGFYSRACDGNYAQGCNNLAWLYLRGRGVPQDPPHALSLFMAAFDSARIACARGEGDGCLLAGEMLLEGRGVASDEAEAVAFFQLACENGEQRGCAEAAREP